LASQSLGRIIAGCRAGNTLDRQALYFQYFGKVRGLAVRLVGSQDADDVTQQSFLQLFRGIHLFRGEAKFDTWLYRLVVNECHQHRRKKRGELRSLDSEPPDDRPGSFDRVESHELLDQALARLEPELRTVVVLREMEQLSYSQLASILSVPEGTIASRLSKARSLLKQHLVELGWTNQ
jgi:RNA polymerase sigma-70 factor (ECF subfamily)